MPRRRANAAEPKGPTFVTKQTFDAELFLGHKGVTAVLVPFDPELVWGAEPIAIDSRREGWLVRGTMNGARFDGWIGYRWGRHFIIVEPELRAAARTGIGESIRVVVEPTASARALAKARE